MNNNALGIIIYPQTQQECFYYFLWGEPQMKKMTKIITAILAVAMLFSLAACGKKAPASDTDVAVPSAQPTETEGGAVPAEFKTVEDGILHMATNAAFPPYEMIAGNEGYEGIDVEIATLIAKKLGLELVVDDMDFGSVIASVQTGKSDIAMAGLTVKPDRLEQVDFTESYATGIQVVIVKEDSDIAAIEDLEGKMIGTQEATTGYLYCSDAPENGGYGEEAVIAYTNGATAVQALIDGKVDCVVIDNEPAKAYVQANKGLKILETEFTTEDYAIGVSKKNTALKDAVNTALKELIADGSVKAIIEKYIPAE